MPRLPEQTEDWQERFDEDFPRGAMVLLVDGSDDPITFPTAYIEVEERDGRPVLHFYDFVTQGKDFYVRVDEYEVARKTPHKVIRVVQAPTKTDPERSFLLSASVTDDMASKMERRRAYILDIRKQQKLEAGEDSDG